MQAGCAITRGANTCTAAMTVDNSTNIKNSAVKDAMETVALPRAVTNTEELALWLNREGRGKRTDLQGRQMRPKGGYEKDVYGLEWHEHPHAHWYLPFVPGHTQICNGSVFANDRIALICEGPQIAFDNITFEGPPRDSLRSSAA
jgi:hypothetical protein